MKQNYYPERYHGRFFAWRVALREWAIKCTSWHQQQLPPIFIFGIPRGGSTWLAEVLWANPRMRFINEPFYIRNPSVSARLGISLWEDLYSGHEQKFFEGYVRNLLSGKRRDRDFRSARLFTNRALIKHIHAGQNHMPWFCETFQGKAILLLRHPIATALSRKHTPLVDCVTKTRVFEEKLSAPQRELCQQMQASDCKISKGVLSWCLHFSLALNNLSRDVLVVTYEQLVTAPENPVRAIAAHCQPLDAELMLKAISKPSRSVSQSDLVTQQLMAHADSPNRRVQLISRWCGRVNDAERRRCQEILDSFEIDAYSAFEPRPSSAYLL